MTIKPHHGLHRLILKRHLRSSTVKEETQAGEPTSYDVTTGEKRNVETVPGHACSYLPHYADLVAVLIADKYSATHNR